MNGTKTKWLAFLMGGYMVVTLSMLLQEFECLLPQRTSQTMLLGATWFASNALGALWGGRSRHFSWRQAPWLVILCTIVPLWSLLAMGIAAHFTRNASQPILLLAVSGSIAPIGFLIGMGFCRLCGWMNLNQIENPFATTLKLFNVGIVLVGAIFWAVQQLKPNALQIAFGMVTIGCVVHFAFERIPLHSRLYIVSILFMLLWMGLRTSFYENWHHYWSTNPWATPSQASNDLPTEKQTLLTLMAIAVLLWLWKINVKEIAFAALGLMASLMFSIWSEIRSNIASPTSPILADMIGTALGIVLGLWSGAKTNPINPRLKIALVAVALFAAATHTLYVDKTEQLATITAILCLWGFTLGICADTLFRNMQTTRTEASNALVICHLSIIMGIVPVLGLPIPFRIALFAATGFACIISIRQVLKDHTKLIHLKTE